jgi:hypothetical protein
VGQREVAMTSTPNWVLYPQALLSPAIALSLVPVKEGLSRNGQPD